MLVAPLPWGFSGLGVASAMGSVPPDRAGLASGVNNTARQAAGAIGIAIFGAIAGSPADPDRFVAGLHALGAIAAALWLGALGLALVVLPSRGALTRWGGRRWRWRRRRAR